ncbi:uncharacterized protein LOC108671463 [Hyalella azteca]|uniref:Uncharacterized protein LOC108671463 n=1 Tax=Hyalella azteca TaxID=294128 RepID=A0A8B7NLF8_HYAAZ|nr:uncharacterized protein LOC108671463 [Hyalella azteca]
MRWSSEMGFVQAFSVLSVRTVLFMTFISVYCLSMLTLYNNTGQSFDSANPILQQEVNEHRAMKCYDLFTVQTAFEFSNYAPIVRKNMEVLKNTWKNWTIKPYKELQNTLPSLIEKVKPNFDADILLRKFYKNITEASSLMSIALKRIKYGGYVRMLDAGIESIKLAMLHQQREYSYKLKSRGNRVEQLHGQLPYVPCRIKTQFSEGELKQCFRRAAEGRDTPYTIVFMGDSKSRRLYDSFVTQTKELNYTISTKGVRRTFVEGLLHFDPEAPYEEAVPNDLPQIKVVNIYSRFDDRKLKEFAYNKALKKIVSWTKGDEPPPDVLTLSYGDWIFFIVDRHIREGMTLLDALDFSWTINELLLRLLKRLSRTTRILVLAQYRHQPHASNILSTIRTQTSIDGVKSELFYRQLMHLWENIIGPLNRSGVSEKRPAAMRKKHQPQVKAVKILHCSESATGLTF